MTTRTGLTDAEISTYKQDGLVIPDYRLPESVVSELASALDQVIAANPEVPTDRLINAHVERPAGDGVRGHRAFLELARNEAILDRVQSVIGPDIILWSTHVFSKQAGTGREVPWHQDGHYWPIRPLATASVWVAIDDVTVENGAMNWIPGSHRDGRLFTHHTEDREELALNQVLDAGQLDETTARTNVLDAGQFSLHDVYLVHGSPPNRSDRRRAGLVLRFMPATSLFDRTIDEKNNVVDYSQMPIWLVRGEDRHGGNDFEIGHTA